LYCAGFSRRKALCRKNHGTTALRLRMTVISEWLAAPMIRGWIFIRLRSFKIYIIAIVGNK
ncbi:MAG: hypothetical protein ORN98_07445, partial [Alphaproteobacteria bacterium]|nr:hypothetical protein [Alphaproteobacteria bacterium]